MKKKILTTVIVTVIFAVMMVSTFFIVFSNISEYNRVQDSLKNFTTYIIKLGIENEKVVNNYKINDVVIRCTYINKNGEVIYDNMADELDNHLNRKEVKEAISHGDGYGVRMSKTTGEKLLYYARQLDNGNILRVSIPYKNINFFNTINSKYSIILLCVVILFSITLSMKIIRTIVEPLKDLEIVTNRIAHGDLHIRANVNTNDEIGSLGMTFNNMADQLRVKISEVVDRQNRLESILRSVQSGVIAVNMKDEIITINPYAKRVLGIKEYNQGEKLSDYIKDYDINLFLSEEDNSEKVIKLLYPFERELRIKKASLLNETVKIGKVIAIHDITDIKKLENMRSQFVTNVSHELKTPLTSIKGFSETLKYVDDKETRDKFLDIINKEAERLTRLINDILVLSKIESSHVIEFEEFNPTPILEDVINIVKSMDQSKNAIITLNNSYYESISGDKDKFLQLFLNLIENAVKYSGEDCKVIVNSYKSKDKYIVEVIDNGIGIPQEDISRIFERFYRVDKSRKGSSTGLGLAIVKHIVKSFNGELHVESKLGEGSKFTVKFNI